MRAIAPNGLEISGTLETVTGCAETINFRRTKKGKLRYDYGGETDMFWDEQRSVLDAKGQEIFLDSDGNQWSADDLELVEEGED